MTPFLHVADLVILVFFVVRYFHFRAISPAFPAICLSRSPPTVLRPSYHPGDNHQGRWGSLANAGDWQARAFARQVFVFAPSPPPASHRDRKSTRLNSSHIQKSRMPSSA